jgi:hypothetical protein
VILPNRDTVKTVVALHQQDASCRVVVASLRAGGGAGGEIDIKAAETVNLAAGPAMFTSLMERFGTVDAVIRVLPASCTIVRVCAIPESGPALGGATPDSGAISSAAVANALELMAESDLPAAIPAYRKAAGLINPGRNANGTPRKPVGLLTGWPATADLESASGLRTPRIAPEVAVSEAAALAMLAQLVGGVDRGWTIDRSAGGGAMTILAAGPEKVIVRVARIPAGETGNEARRAAIVETSRAAGLASAEWGGASPTAAATWLTLQPTPLTPRIAGQLRTADWLSQYGLAAAAIVAFVDPNPAVSGLVALHEVEPKAKPPILQRISEFLGAPKLAAAVIILCVLTVLTLPFGVSYAKLAILKRQVPDERKLLSENEADERELAFYKLLRERRWPMTKLLADAAGACPQGITVESVEVGQGDGITLRGLAEDTDQLTTFRENLGKTRVFSDPTTPSVAPTATGVLFTLTAKVAPNAATFPAKPAEDWAANTLEHRLYPGQKPSTSGGRSGSSRPDRSSARTERRSGTSARSNGSSARDSFRDAPSRPDRSMPSNTTKAPPVIPPPLADDDIAKLSRDDAMKEWTSRKKVAAQPGVDEATKRRLMEESEKAKARMQQLQGGGR